MVRSARKQSESGIYHGAFDRDRPQYRREGEMSEGQTAFAETTSSVPVVLVRDLCDGHAGFLELFLVGVAFFPYRLEQTHVASLSWKSRIAYYDHNGIISLQVSLLWRYKGCRIGKESAVAGDSCEADVSSCDADM